MGEGRRDFRLRWSRPKQDFELNGLCSCWPNVLGPRPKRGTSHRSVLARARHRPCCAQSLGRVVLRAGPISPALLVIYIDN